MSLFIYETDVIYIYIYTHFVIYGIDVLCIYIYIYTLYYLYN